MLNNPKMTDVSVSFRTIAHFFDTDDPSPEECRELSDRAEEEIAKNVTYFLKTIPLSGQGDLIVFFPQTDINQKRELDLPLSISSHFNTRIIELERDRKLIWWEGIREFRLTIAVLIPALLGIGITTVFAKDVVAVIVQNILVICSWVVIWQPFQTLVFDRWAISVRIRIYKHITKMKIQIKPGKIRD
jgi:hypothetical protein